MRETSAVGRIRELGRRAVPMGIIAVAALACSACAGVQSTLAPASREAAEIMALGGWLFGGAAVIWLLLVAAGFYAIRARPSEDAPRRAAAFIIGGGIVVPVVVLTALLTYSLNLMTRITGSEPGLVVEVVGERWWWRVRYRTADGSVVETANEIHLPVGETVRFDVRAADVIHAFWIPALGGKIDMIPGRVNRLTVTPVKTGRFRGACAEYCGLSHAFMAFDVFVTERAEFERWLEARAAPAEPPETPRRQRGLELFVDSGCGACHRIEGTPAAGAVGPDLTHFGARASVGAGLAPATFGNVAAFVADTEAVKPGVRMPAYHMLEPDELEAVTAYLEGLE